MATLNDETYFSFSGAAVPRFVVRWIDKHGEPCWRGFASKRLAAEFRDRIDPPRKAESPEQTPLPPRSSPLADRAVATSDLFARIGNTFTR